MSYVDISQRLHGLISVPTLVACTVVWIVVALAVVRWVSSRVSGFWSISVLAAANLLFFFRPLLTSATIPRGGGDLVSYYFPLHAFAAEQLNQGHIALWNPRLFAGMPQIANLQAGMLYPPNLIAWLVVSPYRYSVLEFLVIGHVFLASVGVWLLSRSLGMSRVAAVAAGIVFAYSGFLTAHTGHYTIVAVAAWLPYLLFALRQLVVRRSWWWALLAGLLVFLMVTAGHQPTLLQALTIAAMWWLFWLAVREQWFINVRMAAEQSDSRVLLAAIRYLVPDVFRAGMGLILGLLLAAPVILPSLELARLSVRSAISYDEATAFSAEPIVLVLFLLPKVFGSNPTDFWGPFSNGEIWAYVGVSTLVFVAIGLAVRRDATRLFFAGLGLVSLIYAIGPFAPLHGWVWRFVPLYDLIRAPARAFLFVDLALAMLAGFGIHELSAAPGLWPERLTVVLRNTVRVLVIGLAALVLFVLPLFYSLILRANDFTNRPVIAINGIVVLTIFLGLAALLIWSVLRGHLAGSVVALGAIALIVVDLFSATAAFNPSSDDVTSGFRHPVITRFLRNEWMSSGPFRIESASARWQPNTAAIIGVDDIGGTFDPMQLRDYSGVRDAATADRTLPLYDTLNTRFLITDVEADNPGPGFVQVLGPADDLVVWENQEAMPRAWLVPSAEAVDIQTAIAQIRRPDFDPRSVVYVSGTGVASSASDGTGAPVASVAVGQAGAERLHIIVTTDHPAYLVISQANYPGWRATIDGHSVELLTANGVFQAVEVPAGVHEVGLQFKPSHLTLFAGASGLAIVLAVSMGVLGWQERRRAVQAVQ